MNNPQHILQTLDRYLTKPAEITIFGRAALALGFPNSPTAFATTHDVDAILPLSWLAAEGNFTYMGGGDVERHGDNVGKAEFYAFTFGPKFYPLGLAEAGGDSHSAQPYASIGIGGAKFDAGDSTIDSEGSFVARFLLGFDIWATDHVGFFVEGGGYAASEEDVEGVGLLTFGGQYRF